LWRSETQTAKLTASDGAAGDDLGGSVGVSHDTVVAGSDGKVNGNNGQGAVYVFLKPKGGWRSETEAAKLTASDGAYGDTLGTSAAISGDSVVAGAPDENGTPRLGAVYVFVRPRGGWRSETQTAKLTASDATPGELFGSSAAISGDTVVAGAAFANAGAVYVFVEPRRGWTNETETAKLTASDGAAGDDLGVSVAVWHDTVVAGSGATINGNAGQGAAYVFGAGGSQSVAGNATAARDTHRRPALPRSCYRARARRSARARGPRIITILARSRPCTASPVRSPATGRRAGIR
jgi:hypothetical protein